MRQLLARQRKKKRNPPLAVLISGRGSNLSAMIDAEAVNCLGATIRLVVSSNPHAPGLALAERAGIAVRVMHPGSFPTRAAHDVALAELLVSSGIQFVCLAGYMLRVGPPTTRAYAQKMLNIHPSLLPAFPGRNAAAQALAHGVKVAGCTVHFVTDEIDAGPIVAQAAVPVWSNDTVDSLKARILAEEHRIYPQVIRWMCQGFLRFDGRLVDAECAGVEEECL